MVQWLRLRASTAGGAGLIPGQGRSCVLHCVAKKKKKKIRFICMLNGMKIIVK